MYPPSAVSIYYLYMHTERFVENLRYCRPLFSACSMQVCFLGSPMLVHAEVVVLLPEFVGILMPSPFFKEACSE
jgi:hypothetical protein